MATFPPFRLVSTSHLTEEFVKTLAKPGTTFPAILESVGRSLLEDESPYLSATHINFNLSDADPALYYRLPKAFQDENIPIGARSDVGKFGYYHVPQEIRKLDRTQIGFAARYKAAQGWKKPVKKIILDYKTGGVRSTLLHYFADSKKTRESYSGSATACVKLMTVTAEATQGTLGDLHQSMQKVSDKKLIIADRVLSVLNVSVTNPDRIPVDDLIKLIPNHLEVINRGISADGRCVNLIAHNPQPEELEAWVENIMLKETHPTPTPILCTGFKFKD